MTRSTDTIRDEMLVLAAQAGDGAAFEALLRRWLPVMRRHAAWVTGDIASVDDVCQEACLAMVAGIKGIRDPAAAYGWMLRTVTNKAVDWVRRRRRDRELSRTLRNRELRAGSSDQKSEPCERAALIRAACLQLPTEMRALVSLFYGEGLPVAAIAGLLGVPAGTVKSRLHEARVQLKNILERNSA